MSTRFTARNCFALTVSLLCLAFPGFAAMSLAGPDGPVRGPATGEQAQTFTKRVIFSQLTRRDGVPEGAIRRIIQDRQGNLWFAAETGLCRFDGYEVRQFLGSNEAYASSWTHDLTDFCEGQNGWFWIATAGNGLFRFNPNTRTLARIRAGVKPGDLFHDAITALLPGPGDGMLWVGTPYGLHRFDPKTEKFQTGPVADQPREAAIEALVRDRAGRVWAAIAGHGLYRQRERNGWDQVWNSKTRVNALAAGEQSIWVATADEGLLQLNLEDGKVVSRVRPDGVNAEVRSVSTDSRGNIWAGTADALCRLDPRSSDWTVYRHQSQDHSSVSPGAVSAIFEDGRQVLWTGTSQGGISRHSLNRYWFDQQAIHAEGENGPLRTPVWGLCEAPDRSVWIGGNQGLFRYWPETGRIEPWSPPDAPGNDFFRQSIYALLRDAKGRLWLGSRENGLAMLDPETGDYTLFQADATQRKSLPGNGITALHEDRHGQIWVGVQGFGLVSYNEGEGTFQQHLGTGGNSLRFINDIHEDAGGRLWLATVGGGLWHFEPTSGRYTHYRALAKGEPLPSENIADLTGDGNGRLWIASLGGGFSIFDPNRAVMRHYTRENSPLPHWNIYGLVTDDDGLLWMSTGAGLVRFNPKEQTFRVFGVKDGLQPDGFHPKSFLKTRDGRLYFGGPHGLNVVNPRELPLPTSPPRPVLTGLELYGERVEPSEHSQILRKPIAVTDTLRLRYDRQLRLALCFGVLNYAASDQTQFRFRLEGLERGWHPAGDDPKALYTGLKPGNYHFAVEASPDGQNWSPNSARLKLVIDPPWYATLWARSLFAAVIVTGLILGMIAHYRMREKRQRLDRERLESQKAQAETALWHQIQHSMLLRDTSAEFRRCLDSSQVFQAALSRIAGHFGASRCLIGAFEETGGRLKVLAQHVAEGTPLLEAGDCKADAPLLSLVLKSESPISIEGTLASAGLAEGNESLAQGVQSTLAIRTAYLDQPNGIIVLQQCDQVRFWQEEELQLLQPLANQLGIAIAQFMLSRKEAQQRRQLEEARWAADEANRAKSDFLARMTHELRTPLNAIIGFSEMLGSDDQLSGRHRETIEIINSSGEHLLGIINDVLEISKIEAGKTELAPERFDLEQLLRTVHGMLSNQAEKKGIGFALVKTTDLPRWVEADKGKLRQVVINLVGNALKFTTAGGVSLRAAAHYAKDVDLAAGRRAFTLTIEVLDTGPGIGEEELSHLFQKFVQTKSGKSACQGTGLGLAIAKGFVELMDGRLTVDSKPGFGSLFTVTLPCVEIVEARERPAPVAAHSTKPGAESSGQMRILVADDAPLNRRLMQKLLESHGYQARLVEDGPAAVAAWREWRPHLIFMDEEMPGLRGTEATRIITREAGADAPVIVSLTAFAFEEQKAAAFEAGCRDFLTKPFRAEDLFALIAKYGPEVQRQAA